MVKKITAKIADILLGIVVTVYIVLEELIWETIAEPIFSFIQELKILQKAETIVNKSNRHLLLAVFLALFVQVEFLGIYALKLIGTGNMVAGAVLYVAKIPVAVFTFWLFRVSKAKLLTFNWFKQAYDLLISIIEKIKLSAIHQRIAAKLRHAKYWFKEQFSPIKASIRKLIDKLRSSRAFITDKKS